MPETRNNEVTMKGNPVTLAGTTPKVGDKAPDFTCVGAGLSEVKLANTAGKARIFSVVPSLDTPVCNIQTKRFAQELSTLGDTIAAYTVSTDLPFAQARFCGEAGITNMTNLSDAHDHSFGNHYGLLITDLPVPLLARAIVVVDAKDKITYVEIVPEIATEPNYDAALAALKAAAGV